jgi:hypothetical protein
MQVSVRLVSKYNQRDWHSFYPLIILTISTPCWNPSITSVHLSVFLITCLIRINITQEDIVSFCKVFCQSSVFCQSRCDYHFFSIKYWNSHHCPCVQPHNEIFGCNPCVEWVSCIDLRKDFQDFSFAYLLKLGDQVYSVTR